MCGILGIIPAIDQHQFCQALKRLSHRGPDDEGVWTDNGQIMLGHRRLAILDLSPGGHQPIISSNGRYAMVFNGEIYNFVEIQDTLIKKGYIFKTQSDSEVLLNAYAEWGHNCLEKLNGMWAFAIWDIEKKTLFLSRDRFGKKPLFYSNVGKSFIFSSEMKAIYPFLSQIRPCDDFNWMKTNYFLYESTDKCLIEGIKRFPAGHWGLYHEGSLKTFRYWNTLDHLVDVPTNYNEQVEKYRELFIDACKIRMRSDVPVGTALSGGLDSSATICTMAYIGKNEPDRRVSDDWQHAFVAAFPGSWRDESEYARQVVRHIGIDATFLEIDLTQHLDKLEDYLYLFEEIYPTDPIPMMAIYGAVKDHGVSVVLDGHGADEQLAGYGYSLFEAFADAGLNINAIKDIFDAYSSWFPEKSCLTIPKHSLVSQYVRFIARKFRNAILRRVQVSKDFQHPNFKRMDNFTRHLYIMTHETILPTLLRNYDRYAMSRGIEIRMPFMDHRIVSYTMSLPWNSKLRNGFTKSIVRDALSPFMPKTIVSRKMKIGFSSPLEDWMKGPMRQYLLDHISSQKFKECALIDPVAVENQVMKAINGDDKEAVLAWIAISPYLWERSLEKGLMH